jgi:hypothetical protein
LAMLPNVNARVSAMMKISSAADISPKRKRGIKCF